MKDFMRQKNVKNPARSIVLIAVMSATLIGGKTALAILPNIEIVTLLCALYGYVFGVIGLAAIFIFILCETLIWGVGTWIISYLIYWTFICLVFMFLNKAQISNRLVHTSIVAFSTIGFGVLTSLIDVGLFMGFYENFWLRFSIYYLRGIIFYALHVCCNITLFLFVFKPLEKITRIYHVAFYLATRKSIDKQKFFE